MTALFVARAQDPSLKCIGRIIVFLLLFVPAAIRYDIGYDYTPIYCDNFDRIVAGADVSDWWTGGFRYLVDWVLFNGWDYQWIFAIVSFITYVPVVMAGRDRYFPIFIFAYFIVFYFFTYNGIRQGVALSFGMWGMRYVLRRSYFKGCIIASMGLIFHSSAVFFLFLFVIVYMLSGFMIGLHFLLEVQEESG